MKRRKKYVRPDLETVYSYDFETELMYGGTFGGGGGLADPGFSTGSGGTSGNLGGSEDEDDSDRAKAGTWGNIWDDDF